ncbi:MAG: hypothetical protein HYX24_05325 [Candidatus Aenigmarchaeota archaeon]|nr:hypothetical protein [Candidatus Aenigmarchaeota archaeon]
MMKDKYYHKTHEYDKSGLYNPQVPYPLLGVRDEDDAPSIMDAIALKSRLKSYQL